MAIPVTAEATSRGNVTEPAQTSVGMTAGLILARNDARKGLIIQNTGTTTIKLSLGLNNPTQTVYHIALKAAGVADDGSGGAYIEDAWTGTVRAVSDAGGGTCAITEIS